MTCATPLPSFVLSCCQDHPNKQISMNDVCTRIYQPKVAIIMFPARSIDLCGSIELCNGVRVFSQQVSDLCCACGTAMPCVVVRFCSRRTLAVTMAEATKMARMSNRIPLRLAQHTCVWFCLKSGEPAATTFRHMQQVFGRQTYSWRSVYRWYSSFKNGRSKLGDLFWGERKTVRIQPTVSACQKLVQKDKHIGIHKLSRTLGVSYGTVHTILHHDLELKKKAPKLISHELTPYDCRRRLAFAFNMLDQFAADPRCIKWICTTDESWFHVYDPRPKQLNMAWLARGENRPQIVCR